MRERDDIAKAHGTRKASCIGGEDRDDSGGRRKKTASGVLFSTRCRGEGMRTDEKKDPKIQSKTVRGERNESGGTESK